MTRSVRKTALRTLSRRPSRRFAAPQAFQWIASISILVWALDISLLVPDDQRIIVESIIRWMLLIALSAISIATIMLPYVKKSDLLFGACFILFVPSICISLNEGHSVAAPLRLAALFLAAGAVATSGRLAKTIPRIVVFTSTAVVGASILYWLVTPDAARFIALGDRHRFAGITSHPNILGYFSVVAFAYSSTYLVKLGHRKNVSNKYMTAFGLLVTDVLAITCMILSDSRSALLATGLALALIILRAPLVRAITRQPRQAVVILIILIIAVSAAPPFYVLLLSDNVAAGSAGAYELSNLEREFAWEASVAAFKENPLLGSGYGTNIFLGEDWTGDDMHLLYSHNWIMTYLMNSGLFGILIILVISVASAQVVVGSVSVRREMAQSPSHMTNVELCSTILIVTFAFAAVESPLQGTMYTDYVFAMAFGFLCEAVRQAAPLVGGHRPLDSSTCGG